MLKNKIKELEKIIEEYQNQLFSFAFFRVGSYEIAQDIVQEVFLKFFEDEKKLSDIENIKTYIFRSISNACIDYKRKYGKIKFIDVNFINDTVTDDSEEEKCVAEFFRIENILIDLPDEQAEVIRLKFVDGLNFVEIAEMLNVSVNTIKSRYRYGIDKLKQTNKITGNYYE
jgi:RNA polymerase sigma-70 factor (ECF subfamily)